MLFARANLTRAKIVGINNSRHKLNARETVLGEEKTLGRRKQHAYSDLLTNATSEKQRTPIL